ncbi:tetratricopeptide repeat protein [Streptomyces sp. HM190]|uniref:tetratricopeptide repeat protein n=1 Tax=Streptomyces sp. HM190 TaxID=2695266 RepID=UPI001358678D|nr:tetratricopeptide repeat protein [Streptomyces sp. HM190]
MSASPDHPPVSVDASGRSAVAAGGNVGQAFTGPGAVGLNIGTAHLMSPVACPRAETVDCPPGLDNLHSRATMFVGRDDELAALDDASAVPGRALAHVLHGLGGIGKSTLAARWASRRSESHADAPAWWIRADSRSAIDAGLADLAVALQPSLFALLPQEQLAEWALRWLASHSGWLLVLDDVSNPQDVTPLLSRATSGRFLITSRQSTGWRGVAEPVPLDVLPGSEAVRLFTLLHREDPGAAELCEELGHLPLAIAQVAAYCAQSGCTAREYLEDLADLPAEMYAAKDENRDHERTVARVWHVTLDRLADDPLTARILLLLAWYAPDGIPRTLLGALGSRPAVRGALGRLAAHSMVTLSPDGDTVSVHRLVQAVSRTKDTSDRHRTPTAVADACTAATQALCRAVPDDIDDPSTWPVMRSLLPHVEELARRTRPEDDTEAMTRLLTRTGDYMLGAGVGLAPRALGLLQRAVSSCGRLFPPDSVELLEARVHVADAQRMLREPRQIASLVEEVLDDCERALGPDHRVTSSARMSAYRVASLTGHHERALRLARETFAGRVRTLGDAHPLTFGARQAVILATAETGDVHEAHALITQLLADCVRVLGEEHPETLAARAVATVLAHQADFPVAPLTAATRVFAVLQDGGDLVGAVRGMVDEFDSWGPIDIPRATEEEVAVAERTLETCLRVLGEDHADTFAAKLALAQVYAATQDERQVERAARLLGEVLSAFGDDQHVTTMVEGLLLVLGTVLGEHLSLEEHRSPGLTRLFEDETARTDRTDLGDSAP